MSDGGDERRREREAFEAWQAAPVSPPRRPRSAVGEVAELAFVAAFWALVIYELEPARFLRGLGAIFFQ